MVYSFEMVQHANIRYRKAVDRLGFCELLSMLRALSLEPVIRTETLGGVSFLTFESRELTGPELSWLRRHSSAGLMALREGDLLRPLEAVPQRQLAEDIPEILKYKGKTGVPFTRMMLNTALSLTPFARGLQPVTVLDPLCGKGTTLFCAAEYGMNALGLDTDRRALKEAEDYFTRYLKLNLLKHRVRRHSETVRGHAVPVTTVTWAPTKDRWDAGDAPFLTLACTDTEDASALTRKAGAHVLVADLPYGIQHAPRTGCRPEKFISLLRRALPSWKQALMPGGAMALSFNTLTLPTSEVLSALRDAGMTPLEAEPYNDMTHEVEQAVTRNAVFAVKE